MLDSVTLPEERAEGDLPAFGAGEGDRAGISGQRDGDVHVLAARIAGEVSRDDGLHGREAQRRLAASRCERRSTALPRRPAPRRRTRPAGRAAARRHRRRRPSPATANSATRKNPMISGMVETGVIAPVVAERHHGAPCGSRRRARRSAPTRGDAFPGRIVGTAGSVACLITQTVNSAPGSRSRRDSRRAQPAPGRDEPQVGASSSSLIVQARCRTAAAPVRRPGRRRRWWRRRDRPRGRPG